MTGYNDWMLEAADNVEKTDPETAEILRAQWQMMQTDYIVVPEAERKAARAKRMGVEKEDSDEDDD